MVILPKSSEIEEESILVPFAKQRPHFNCEPSETQHPEFMDPANFTAGWALTTPRASSHPVGSSPIGSVPSREALPAGAGPTGGRV